MSTSKTKTKIVKNQSSNPFSSQYLEDIGKLQISVIYGKNPQNQIFRMVWKFTICNGRESHLQFQYKVISDKVLRAKRGSPGMKQSKDILVLTRIIREGFLENGLSQMKRSNRGWKQQRQRHRSGKVCLFHYRESQRTVAWMNQNFTCSYTFPVLYYEDEINGASSRHEHRTELIYITSDVLAAIHSLLLPQQ